MLFSAPKGRCHRLIFGSANQRRVNDIVYPRRHSYSKINIQAGYETARVGDIGSSGCIPKAVVKTSGSDLQKSLHLPAAHVSEATSPPAQKLAGVLCDTHLVWVSVFRHQSATPDIHLRLGKCPEQKEVG